MKGLGPVVPAKEEWWTGVRFNKKINEVVLAKLTWMILSNRTAQ